MPKTADTPQAHQRRRLAIIRDYDFSGVRKADAKLVWMWEIARQFYADGYEPEAKLKEMRGFISSPYSEHSIEYLMEWYKRTFESARLP